MSLNIGRKPVCIAKATPSKRSVIAPLDTDYGAGTKIGGTEMSSPCKVVVTSEWRSRNVMEFNTQEEAHDFVRTVSRGGEAGLIAIVNAGDIDSSAAELVDYSAHIES